MKLFNNDMQVAQVGNFQFSGTRPDKLGSPEYTIATMVTDTTGSTKRFRADLLAMKRAVVEACRKSPRRDFLMLRDVEFALDSNEVHGFAELRTLDPAQYTLPECEGRTALFDATFNAVAATNEYARLLAAKDFAVNAIVFVTTDGDDTDSVYTPANVAAEVERGVASEWLESLIVVLIGVNAQQFAHKLESFKTKAKLTQYVDAGEATPENLARLADFVTNYVSSQSQSLGTGGPSQPLTF